MKKILSILLFLLFGLAVVLTVKDIATTQSKISKHNKIIKQLSLKSEKIKKIIKNTKIKTEEIKQNPEITARILTERYNLLKENQFIIHDKTN